MPLPNFSDSIEKNIIRHIKYRGTIRTGEITVDNGDETYDVKIAMSDQSYPDVETLFPNDVFQVGEIVTLGFEYGSKEIPKIIGHGKKVAQVPVEVEVDYSGIARVETLNAYSIDSTTAYLEGRIALGGAGNCATRGFEYGTTTAYGDDAHTDGSYGDGSYAIQITSLTEDTTYHFRAYIIDENGDTIYGEDKSFVVTVGVIYEKSETSDGQLTPTPSSGYKLGQCFTAESNHQVDMISLRCWKDTANRNMKLELYNADGDGYPTGGILADCSFSSNDLPESVNWHNFTLSGTVDLTSGNLYVIVVYTSPLINGMWWRHDDTNPYANGWTLYYPLYWTKMTVRDMTFRIIKTVT